MGEPVSSLAETGAVIPRFKYETGTSPAVTAT
jgi:hypothetical protein